ncbi:MAG: inorganic phosphate transporter [Bacteroidota bacterium]|nr:inorganic phosphate transporter [Bacteroidota bacterium]
MENIYSYMLIALALLAVSDLIVGVSNDAVNFLNSAIGSKAISFKTIMIVASIGVAVGAIFSSGMMEVARKGIFNPGEFMFDEIMIIFLAVMITDILLLDFFNTLGLPTSTTVSIVFELLGAAVVMALLKITASGGGFEDLWGYINTSKASQIIFGIILSVIVAFSIGAIVQWISRLLISFNFDQKPDWVGAVFSGIALTSITYFIFMKGLKGTSYANVTFDIINGYTVKDFLESKVVGIVLASSVFWAVLSYILIAFAKTNIYKLIIVVGTFALALAFAGNDLVNFIGVPVAAYNSFLEWSVSGVAASAFSMDVLASKVPTNNWLLLGAGLVMVLTLWFSSKSKNVVQTSIDLSNQNTTKERFNPNVLSRVIVRASVVISEMVSELIPKNIKTKIEIQFNQAKGPLTKIAFRNRPAFDMVRAAVNLMVASVLISIATSMKLPLSTTYVTFMVAMGTSLADRAWGVESAVYRVAGVLNVIGGWFFTAIVAFTASGLVAFLMNLNIQIMFPVLLFTAFGLLVNSSFRYKKKAKLKQQTLTLKKSESRSVQGVINESSTNISKVLNRGGKIYKTTIFALAQQDLITLKKNKKQVVKLSNEIETLRDDIFYFIKSLDETSVSTSNFYIEILGSLQDMTQSLDYITKLSYKHVNNNHKKLKFNQIKELSEISQTINILFKDAKEIFERQSFDRISLILEQKLRVNQALKLNIDTQVMRTRNEESSPKNTTLYFSLLLETKDLMNATASLLEQYNSNQLK